MLIVSNGMKNAMLAVLPGLFNGGAIFVYSGTQPGSPDSAPIGTLLAVVSNNGDPYTLGSATNGLNITTSTGGYVVPDVTQNWCLRGLAAGVAGWARFVTKDDTLLTSLSLPRIDFVVNDSGTGFLLTNTSITVDEIRPIDNFLYGIPPFNT